MPSKYVSFSRNPVYSINTVCLKKKKRKVVAIITHNHIDDAVPQVKAHVSTFESNNQLVCHCHGTLCCIQPLNFEHDTLVRHTCPEPILQGTPG
jgi:hypothetical protein